jgi:hypothetical protein
VYSGTLRHACTGERCDARSHGGGVDYSGLCKAYAQRDGGALRHSSVLAGVAKQQDLTKLDPLSEPWFVAKENDHADVQAKLVVRFHPEIHEGRMKDGEELGRRIEGLLRFAPKGYLLWPSRPRASRRAEERTGQTARRRNEKLSSDKELTGHQWCWRSTSQRWVCMSCLTDAVCRDKRRDRCKRVL